MAEALPKELLNGPELRATWREELPKQTERISTLASCAAHARQASFTYSLIEIASVEDGLSMFQRRQASKTPRRTPKRLRKRSRLTYIRRPPAPTWFLRLASGTGQSYKAWCHVSTWRLRWLRSAFTAYGRERTTRPQVDG